jgi:DNA-binding transcriptional LysR family regulator
LSDAIVDLVEGGFDVAIRNAKLKDSSLVARKLSPDRRILCASPTYLLEHGEPNTPDDLLNHQCISLQGLDTWVFKTPAEDQSVKISSRLRVDNGEALRDACAQGLGITINSIWSAYQQLKRGDLVEVLKQFPLVTDTSIWAVYPSSRLLAPKVRLFVDYLVERFAGIPYWEQELADPLSS